MAEWARASARHFARALVMPNTLPPVDSARRLEEYRAEIEKAVAPPAGIHPFTPLMAFKIMPGMDEATVAGLKRAGCAAGKYYPAGATTNSRDGLRSPEAAREALLAMEAFGIPLSIHAELPEAPALERESAFLPLVEGMCRDYPRLRIVVEHLSCGSTVDFLKCLPDRVAATLTVHHLLYCLDDMLGESLDPHLFCKPVLKTAKDRRVLVEAALSSDPRFFFGSDSAPHPRARKESGAAPGGVFSAPAALPLLAEFFDKAGKLPLLENFLSAYGARFYGLPPNEGRIRLARKPYRVPGEIAGALPLMAGKDLPFSVESLS